MSAALSKENATLFPRLSWNYALKALRTVRHTLLVWAGREVWFKVELSCDVELHGSSYGGFAILANSLSDSAMIISAGVGEDVSFDLSLIGKYGCVVNAYDPTPRAIAWVDANVADKRFVMHPQAISDTDGTIRLYLPASSDHVSASVTRESHNPQQYIDVECRRLSTVVDSLGMSRVDLLKLDIEGAEYAALEDYLSDPKAVLPQQLAVEFHHFYHTFGTSRTRAVLALLHELGYSIAWVSASRHELLFVRRRSVDDCEAPHGALAKARHLP